MLVLTIGSLGNSNSLILPIQVNPLTQSYDSETFVFSPQPINTNVPRQIIPHITPNITIQGETNKSIIVYNFVIKDSIDPTITEFQVLPPFQVNFSINNSVYYGAKNAIKSTYFFSEITPEQNYYISYNSFVDDPYQNELYENLLTELRKYRFQNNLDDNEYLELIVRFVQSIPNEERNYSRFPIETLFEGNGVCEDKSFLLAGLLEREGYDVGLFTFTNVDPKIPGHMVVGVKSNGLQYPGTDYTLIETTMSSPDMVREYHYIGLVNLQGYNPKPIFIKIGNGTKKYTKSDDIAYINDSIYSCFSQLNHESSVDRNSNSAIDNLGNICQLIERGAPDRESVVIWFKKHGSPIRAPENINFFNSSDSKPFYKFL
ncbi:hypothetical protein [Methanoregula sp.]|jgi:hypothetical protein|uniref:hypothetical protein n=1 Tax=Methanoregula sp. TaxID=2052170 RepID=UPI003C78176F